MTDTFNPPSDDPANDGSVAGLLRLFGAKLMQGVDDMLPARVIAYDRVRNRATVQPIIMVGTTDGQKVSRAQIASVPVLTLGGGGFVLAFPIVPGDLGWIKANDRDISLFLQGLTEDWPHTARTHSFQDGLFIPDIIRQWTLQDEDADRVVLQSTDGATRIALGEGTVHITAPTSVTITAPDTTVDGRLLVTGAARVEGAFKGDTSITDSNGIVLDTHKHSGVTTGAAKTLGPTSP